MTFTWYESLRTPAWWERLTWLLLGTTGLLAVVAAAAFVLAAPLTDSPGAAALRVAFLVLFVLLMAGYAAWRHSTRRIAARYGDRRAADGLPAGLARVSPVPVVAPLWYRPAEDLDRATVVLSGRLAALVLLAVAIVLIRFRLRALVADQAAQIDAATRARSLGLPVPAAPRAPRPVEPHAVRPADDTFWAEVSGRAAAVGTDLALLEWIDDRTGRWHLVGADPAPVRAALPAGAVLVVYPDPPHPPAAHTGQRAPDLRHAPVGLILQPDGPRFERLWAGDDLDWWLPRAQSADRIGLYPVDPAERPGSLVATVPPADAVR